MDLGLTEEGYRGVSVRGFCPRKFFVKMPVCINFLNELIEFFSNQQRELQFVNFSCEIKTLNELKLNYYPNHQGTLNK